MKRKSEMKVRGREEGEEGGEYHFELFIITVKGRVYLLVAVFAPFICILFYSFDESRNHR